MAKVTLIDKLKVKTGRRTQFDNCRQIERKDHSIFNLTEGNGRTFDDCLNAIPALRLKEAGSWS